METKPWRIGLFLIVGLGLTTAILFLIGDQEKAFGRHLTVYTEFTNLSGLPDGAKVRVSGLDAGEVKKIEIPKTPSGRFRVELQLEDKVRGMIREDSIASIQTQGVVGDQFVSIQKGSIPQARSAMVLPFRARSQLTFRLFWRTVPVCSKRSTATLEIFALEQTWFSIQSIGPLAMPTT